jgi:LysM repeat protein
MVEILRFKSFSFLIKTALSLAALGLSAWLLAACGYPTPPGGGGLTPYVVVITPTPLPQSDTPVPPSPTAAPTATPVASVAIAATIPPNTPAPTPKYTPTLPVVGDRYTVQAGDTLFGICKRLGVSYDDMVTLNNLQDPDNLQIGQVLKIPPRTSSVLGPTATPTPNS